VQWLETTFSKTQHHPFVMAKKRGPSTSAPLRSLAPKPTDKEQPRVSTVEERKQLYERWILHVLNYRESLGGDQTVEPNRSHFEKVNNVSRGTLDRIEKTIELAKMVPDQCSSRKYARAEVRPFYPVEKILNKLIIYLREQKVTVDVWLVRILAMVVYEHLLKKFGEMTFERPKFSYRWAASFMKFWYYERVKLRGEADSVNLSEIKEEVEKLQELIAVYQLKDVYNADETGLFLQTALDQTLVQKLDNTKKARTKSSATRLSILFGTNATGTDKVRPFLLSKCSQRCHLS